MICVLSPLSKGLTTKRPQHRGLNRASADQGQGKPFTWASVYQTDHYLGKVFDEKTWRARWDWVLAADFFPMLY